MPEAIIELDISTPWEPVPRPAGRWRRRRWGLGALVLAAAASLLTTGAAPRDLEPLYSTDFQVLSFQAAGGRFLVSRYQAGGGQPVIEALDARLGTVLWRRTTENDEAFVTLTERIALVQIERADEDGEYAGRLVALDAATGAQLWERPRARIAGLAGGRVLANDLAWPDEPEGFDPAYGNPDDPAVALPLLPHHVRYVALEPETGAEAWRAESPPGTVPSLFFSDYPWVTRLSELDAAGVLRERDLATGAVTGTYRLDWSGAIAGHQAGTPGQEVVWRAGGTGADVYDRASGRLLWHRPGPAPAYNGPYPCLGDRYCLFYEDGTDVLDAATGARLWRADGYTSMLDAATGRLLLYREVAGEFRPVDVAAFDARTGAVAWHQRGWLLASGYVMRMGAARDYFVWRPVGNTDAVIGRLDPRGGTVEVIGRAANFYGTPVCAATAGRLACLAIGVLHVWALP
ncbi:PQQ-binding-like beta-propeller repeat protein [Dactylosporangium sp. NPDC048998]|uniref:outer membrane protein assembly factor BamB family protein n=1 Tax=Dactylosporangium sp. NPDC048998 TaxID=3363976 RepID=UPI0037120D0C